MTRSTTAILCLLLLVSIVTSELVQSPLRVRVNAKLLRRIFHKNDHDTLNILKDVNIPEYDLSSSKVKDL
jgi:hypothetical protein